MTYKFLKINNRKFFTIKFNISYFYHVIIENKNFIITGGSSINFFLKKLVKILKKKKIKKKNFFLSDERLFCTAENSNSKKISSLFQDCSNSLKFYAINSYPENINKEIIRYNSLIPKKIDAVFLSLGKNFHIASLFQNMRVHFVNENILLTSDLNFEYQRISINKKLLSNADKIYLFINGMKRYKEFKYMVNNKIINKYFSKKTQSKIILVFLNKKI